MAVESGTYVNDLNTSYPGSGEPLSQGDDHLRLIKTLLKATFPNATGPWATLAHTWTAAQTFTGGVVVSSTDAGAGVGPTLDLYRDSATPAASDIIGRVLFSGEDSAGNKETYAEIYSQIGDPTSTSEDAGLLFSVVTAGALATELALTGAALYPATDLGLNLGATGNRFNTAYLTTVELGHATDLTLSRYAAGVLGIEGGSGDIRARRFYFRTSSNYWDDDGGTVLRANGGSGQLQFAGAYVGNPDTYFERESAGVLRVAGTALVKMTQANAVTLLQQVPSYPGYLTPTWWPLGDGLWHLVLR